MEAITIIIRSKATDAPKATTITMASAATSQRMNSGVSLFGLPSVA